MCTEAFGSGIGETGQAVEAELSLVFTEGLGSGIGQTCQSIQSQAFFLGGMGQKQGNRFGRDGGKVRRACNAVLHHRLCQDFVVGYTLDKSFPLFFVSQKKTCGDRKNFKVSRGSQGDNEFIGIEFLDLVLIALCLGQIDRAADIVRFAGLEQTLNGASIFFGQSCCSRSFCLLPGHWYLFLC